MNSERKFIKKPLVATEKSLLVFFFGWQLSFRKNPYLSRSVCIKVTNYVYLESFQGRLPFWVVRKMWREILQTLEANRRWIIANEGGFAMYQKLWIECSQLFSSHRQTDRYAHANRCYCKRFYVQFQTISCNKQHNMLMQLNQLSLLTPERPFER